MTPEELSRLHSTHPFPRAQREQIEREKREHEKKAAGCLQHANELRRQVRENQQKHVQNRLATFEEGRRLKEEAEKRRERIEDIKKQKLEELRCAAPGSLLSFLSSSKSWRSRLGTPRGRAFSQAAACPLKGALAEGSGTGSRWLTDRSLPVR